METKTIADIAFTIKYCREHNKPKPIILCGAGISKTAGIPLTGQIIEEVFEKFSGKSSIQKLINEKSTNYYEIMRALRAEERRDLFKQYIESENVRLNLASIYIALLLKHKCVDYVFTVNFDDLLIRASSIFNFVPPIYDLANVPSLNTNKFEQNSVVYLHGQYYGQWLLNTPDEIEKGLNNVHNLFQRECHRPWIVVGYSGEDEIFDKLNEIPSFSSDLYWVSFNEKNINAEVRGKLLDAQNKNAYVIPNMDADTFFLQLCTELKLPYPPLFDKPFTFLETYFDNIQDFTSPNEDHKTLYENLAQQKQISLGWVKEAKETIENSKSEEHLIQEIIDKAIKKEFNDEDVLKFERKINDNNYTEAKKSLSNYYNNWGNALQESAKQRNDEKLYNESFEKYEKAILLNPDDYQTYYNWGIASYCLAKQKNDEKLYNESFEKYTKASLLNPNDYTIFYNWGVALYNLTKLKNDENLYNESFEKYAKASHLNPNHSDIFNNWAVALRELANQKNDEKLYNEAFEKYTKASLVNPDDYKIFYNWGIALRELANQKKDTELYSESFEKYAKASRLNPNYSDIFINWGIALSQLFHLKNDKKILDEAEKIILKGVELGSSQYNLACLYALKKEKPKALETLDISLKNKEVTIGHIREDQDWQEFKDDEDFNKLLEKYE